MKINFVIKGNNNDPHGDPLPAALSNAQVAGTSNYKEWQRYIRNSFFQQVKQGGVGMAITDQLDDLTGRALVAAQNSDIKPIQIQFKEAAIKMDIYWGKGGKGNALAVFTSVLEALFQTPGKAVKAEYFSRLTKERKGRIEVEIEIVQKIF